MKAKSFLAVLCVLLMTLAIVGCGSDGGTGGDRVIVAVDESIPAITADLLDVEFTGSFPSGENEAAITPVIRNFIVAFQTARKIQSGYYIPGEARAVGADDDNTEIWGEAYDNYKVSGKKIYVEGYSNFTDTKSYRTEVGPVKDDTRTESSDSVWAITYDDESVGGYQLSGKAVNKEWGQSSNVYTTSNSGSLSYSYGSTQKEAFAVSDGTTSLKYILEISQSESGTETFPPAPPVVEDPPNTVDEIWNKYYGSYTVYFAVYDMNNAKKLEKASSNSADREWIIGNILQ
jgi:hypothetical protein